jgi:hypothetical protein
LTPSARAATEAVQFTVKKQQDKTGVSMKALKDDRDKEKEVASYGTCSMEEGCISCSG